MRGFVRGSRRFYFQRSMRRDYLVAAAVVLTVVLAATTLGGGGASPFVTSDAGDDASTLLDDPLRIVEGHDTTPEWASRIREGVEVDAHTARLARPSARSDERNGGTSATTTEPFSTTSTRKPSASCLRRAANGTTTVRTHASWSRSRLITAIASRTNTSSARGRAAGAR